MECNKEDAVRAKVIAERKLAERDIVGAKKFAMKAHILYPALDGLSQFLETVNVYMAAEKRSNGEVDWYNVLGVEPSADDDTIRKHYRKLALSLHPDKNKSVGADGAFKILSEAWSLLSDKAKRIAYDQKRAWTTMDQNIPKWEPSVPPGQNGSHIFFNNNNPNARTEKSAMHPKPAPAPYNKPNTFWTICNGCQTQFEYVRNYLNHNLLCQNCRRPFFAVEMPPPPINGNGPRPRRPSYMQGQHSTQHTRVENSYAASLAAQTEKLRRKVDDALQSAMRQEYAASSAAQSEKLRRKVDDGLPTAMRQESVERQMKMGDGLGVSGSVTKGDRLKKKRRIYEHRVGESSSQKINFEAVRGNVAGNHKSNSARDLSPLEIRNMLMEKARKDICEKLKGWSSVAAVSITSKKEMENQEKGKQKIAVNSVKAEADEFLKFVDGKTRAQTNESSPAKPDDDLDAKGDDLSSMSVPDPDFHDFDKDRCEKSFGDNQVWAAYDNDDGMPRYYAIIHNVISLKPFKMRISWLNSKSTRELGPMNWIGCGFYKTCGDFWVGKREVNNSINSFSHRVKWTKGTRGTIQIYPRKGDVWALYRNWSSDWNEHTTNDVIHKYDMVRVLEDYNEERGATVAPLVKVAGFKTVFRHHSDPSKTRTIPREEMFRFSHQVPSFLLTGQEGHNSPKGCWELDPASTPLELLQVLTEVQQEELLESAENAKETEPFGDMNKFKEEQLVENGWTTKGKGVADDATRKDAAEMQKNKGKETKEKKIMVYQRRRQKEIVKARGFSVRFDIN